MSTRLVFLLEEPSARELIKGLLPRLSVDPPTAIYLVFDGKQDLEKNLSPKLRGWRDPSSRFVVLRDQDAAPDCREVKARLVPDVTASRGRPVLVRVACRELEAWVAGDLKALAQAYDKPSVLKAENDEAFRDPDALVRPIEALRRLVPDYTKVDGARRVGPLLDPDRNRSTSFRAFCRGLQTLVES